MAKASGECMIKTGYLDTVSKAYAEAAHKRLQKKPGLITEWKKLRDQELANAKKYNGAS
ncbi:MAG: hypothetical protein E7A62_07405 [Actinomycetaceae bacterium]|nr:hypothetical protein [Actinomycetaceae bacterium]MDU0970805.1 hypothetical protein [Actinomycetaceae bacterium]